MSVNIGDYVNRGAITRRPIAPGPENKYNKYASHAGMPTYESKSTATNIRLQPSLKAEFTTFCKEHGFSFAEGVAAAMRCFMDVAAHETDSTPEE